MLCKSTATVQYIVQLFTANVVACHGMPKRVLSDHDPHFVSSFWCFLVAALGCEQLLSNADHPQTDGQTECMHQSIKQVLWCYVSARQTDWEDLLPMCEFDLNSSCSATTGYSPAYAGYGREHVLSLEYALCAVVNCKV